MLAGCGGVLIYSYIWTGNSDREWLTYLKLRDGKNILVRSTPIFKGISYLPQDRTGLYLVSINMDRKEKKSVRADLP